MLYTLGMISVPIPTHPSHPLAQILRAAPLAWVVATAFPSPRRGRRPGGPLLGTTCVVSVGRGDHTPPSQISFWTLAGGSHTPGTPRRWPAPVPGRGRAPSRPARQGPFHTNLHWFPNASPTAQGRTYVSARIPDFSPPAPKKRSPACQTRGGSFQVSFPFSDGFPLLFPIPQAARKPSAAPRPKVPRQSIRKSKL